MTEMYPRKKMQSVLLQKPNKAALFRLSTTSDSILDIIIFSFVLF